MKRQRASVFALVVAAAASVLLVLSWWWHGRHLYAAEVATICDAEIRSGTTLAQHRIGVEEWLRSRLKTSSARALLERIRHEPPSLSANDLRRASAEVRLARCASAQSYASLAQRTQIQLGFDKACRELDPIILEHTPREQRMGVLGAWIREHGCTDVCAPVFDRLSEGPWERAKVVLPGVLSELDIHRCGALIGFAAPTDPRPGPNVALRIVKLDDDREPRLAAAIHSALPAIQSCYQHELDTTPAIGGTLEIKLRVDRAGAVELAAAQEESTLRSAAVATCALRAVRGAQAGAGRGAANGGASFDFFLVR